jgi:hypothetical protein
MPEILTEIMSGRVDFTCSTIATALPFIREGKLVALALSTPQRSSALPDVPTTLEAGYKNSDYTFWTGLFVPAKTPREITGLPTPVGFGSTSLNPGGSGFEVEFPCHVCRPAWVLGGS